MKSILSLLLAFALTIAPAITFAAYGGGSASSIGNTLSKDVCPNGDNSGSYYDKKCSAGTTSDDASEETSGVTLDGYIFFDEDKDNVFDSDEIGVQGAVITLKTTGNSILDTDVTGSNGYYAFYNVKPGTYKVHVSLPVTKKSFGEALVAFFVPKVAAASDYEFTVVVGEGETGKKNAGNVPVVDGKAQTAVVVESTPEETTDAETTPTATTPSIFDILRDRANTQPTDVNTDSGNTGGFVLPTSLPNTGASL